MKQYVPDYYPRFHCKAGACAHNCCIGWEIDIDEKTLGYYRSLGGAFGERLRASIREEDGCACFVLSENERCPFLNADNLCDVHITCGEEHLSQICTDHPRFRCYIAGRCETGLGLSCEAACALILSKKEKTSWILLSDDGEEEFSSEWEEELFEARERTIAVLQDRTKPLAERLASFTEDIWYGRTPEDWREVFLELERMDTAWEDMLRMLNADHTAWREGDEIVWEQLLVYLVSRHLADAADEWDLEARLSFCILSYAVIRTIAEGIQRKNGASSEQLLYETARMYSAEIEYSEDNTAALTEELY